MKEHVLEKIGNFNYQLEKKPVRYLEELYKECPDYPLLVEVFKELLNSPSSDNFSSALNCFVYSVRKADAIPGKEVLHFVEYAEEEFSIFELLKEKLFGKNFMARRLTIEGLVTLGYEDCIDFLNEAFDYYLTCDPLILPQVIQGIIQLSGSIPWENIKRMVYHENYIFRWSFLQLLDMSILDYDISYQLLNVLLEDSVSYVREEGEYKIKLLRTEEKYEEALRSETDEAYGTKLEQERPRITFNGIHEYFIDYLDETGRQTYELDELEDFFRFYFHEQGSISGKFEKFKAENPREN